MSDIQLLVSLAGEGQVMPIKRTGGPTGIATAIDRIFEEVDEERAIARARPIVPRPHSDCLQCDHWNGYCKGWFLSCLNGQEDHFLAGEEVRDV